MPEFIPQDADGNLILGVSSAEFSFMNPAYVAVDNSGHPIPDSGGGNDSASGATRSTTILSTSQAGEIPAGANSVAIANIGANAGIIKGVAFPAGTATSFQAPSRDALDAISYDATNTIFLITTVV